MYNIYLHSSRIVCWTREKDGSFHFEKLLCGMSGRDDTESKGSNDSDFMNVQKWNDTTPPYLVSVQPSHSGDTHKSLHHTHVKTCKCIYSAPLCDTTSFQIGGLWKRSRPNSALLVWTMWGQALSFEKVTTTQIRRRYEVKASRRLRQIGTQKSKRRLQYTALYFNRVWLFENR